MNWYKSAKNKYLHWPSFIATVGTIFLLSFALDKGITINELKQEFEQNPTKVINEAKEFSKQNKDSSNITEEESMQNNVYSLINNPTFIAEIKRHEGVRQYRYFDTENIPTIGVGFNLNKPGARRMIEEVGGNYDRVRRGEEPLSNDQIDALLYQDIETAIEDALYCVPNLNQQPLEVQKIVVNMAFNLGRSRLYGFHQFRAALSRNDYSRAAEEMIDSDWYDQVGRRSIELVQQMREVYKEQK